MTTQALIRALWRCVRQLETEAASHDGHHYTSPETIGWCDGRSSAKREAVAMIQGVIESAGVAEESKEQVPC